MISFDYLESSDVLQTYPFRADLVVSTSGLSAGLADRRDLCGGNDGASDVESSRTRDSGGRAHVYFAIDVDHGLWSFRPFSPGLESGTRHGRRIRIAQ